MEKFTSRRHSDSVVKSSMSDLGVVPESGPRLPNDGPVAGANKTLSTENLAPSSASSDTDNAGLKLILLATLCSSDTCIPKPTRDGRHQQQATDAGEVPQLGYPQSCRPGCGRPGSLFHIQPECNPSYQPVQLRNEDGGGVADDAPHRRAQRPPVPAPSGAARPDLRQQVVPLQGG